MENTFQSTINGETFLIDLGNTYFVNDIEQKLNFSVPQKGAYQFIHNGNTIIADIVNIDSDTKQVVLRIEGKKYTVNIKEPIDIQLEKLGINTLQAKKINNLKSPMPGLVLKILVKEGDIVNAGTPLLILEAMKMENVFKAIANVTIKSIKVIEKQAVEKGQELITFE